MGIFAEKSKAIGQIAEVSTALRSQRAMANQAGQQSLEASTEPDRGEAKSAAPARSGHDFSTIPIAMPEPAADSPAGDNHSAMQPMVTRQRHSFSAAIPRIRAPFQSDSMNAEEREPARAPEAPLLQSAAPPRPADGEAREGETVHFPSSMFPAIALAEQADAIASTFAYKDNITAVSAPAKPDKFGETIPAYKFERPGPSATQTAGTFNVTGTILADITYWVAAPNHTDIASDSDPDITQANYPTVVSDLTPSPTAVDKGGVKLYKNQPPRTKFWARDLTVNHELVHAGEDVKFGQEGVTLAQNWLNSQTAATYDDVGRLLNGVTPRIVQKVEKEMALPGRENRAYGKGAADYTARARAIKSKGDAKGYVPKPPAPKTPPTPPTPNPKATTAPVAPALEDAEAGA